MATDSPLPGESRMPEDTSFVSLIRRVRAGDQDAAAELVRHYEPMVRRVVRLRLVHSRLRRQLDSMDICQSVLGSFFVRVALGQYDLHTPEQLLKLLGVMARNKLADQARKHPALPAETLKDKEGPPNLEDVAAPGPSPSRQIVARDLLQQFRARLSEEERQLADRRARGQEWNEIATEVGGQPDALRKKLTRAVDRVARQMGLEV
jgi:RNA polymerase sigma-70 factor (ECF subfamily)